MQILRFPRVLLGYFFIYHDRCGIASYLSYTRPHSFALGTAAMDDTVLMQATLVPKQAKGHTHSPQLLKQNVTMRPQQPFNLLLVNVQVTQ